MELTEFKPTDMNDLFVLSMKNGLNREAALLEIRQQIKQHLDEKIMTETSMIQKESLNAEIKRLALLDKVEYELTREKVANEFNIRVAKLDEFVSEVQKISEKEKSETILFPNIEPWPEAVSLSSLLNDIACILSRYISFISEHQPRAIALWVIHTYCIEAAYISPSLFVTSAEMRSGKSTLLSILQKISSKSMAASSITPSVIYRIIPKYHPTLIFDEADTYMTDSEDLRGIINAGHSRDTSSVLRTNPDTLDVERFDAFGPKCFGAIKGLPATIEDRSIIIKMRRKAKGQKTAKLRLISDHLRTEFYNIARKCIRFTEDNIDAIKKLEPIIPDKLNDRAADNWYSLFQIAEFAGKEWLKHANEAALYLSGIENENKSLGIELLEDILNLFDGIFKNTEIVTTADLIDGLCADNEAPWLNYNSKRQDTKINARQLANLLSPYGIKSVNNVGTDKRKGYKKADFKDAFSRYVLNDNQELNVTSDIPSLSNHQKDQLAKLLGADSGKSGLERLKSPTQNPMEIPSNIARADVADKSLNLGAADYIDV